GDVWLLDGLSAAPAGTLVVARRASPYGLEVAYELGRGVAAAGLPVVSGLALGVDAAAHRGCVDGGGCPVAVLAGGPDLPQPRTNARPYRRGRAQGGGVSASPPGGAPPPRGLPGPEPPLGGRPARPSSLRARPPA